MERLRQGIPGDTPARALALVQRQVPCDQKEPNRNWNAALVIAWQRGQRLQEDVLGEVCRIRIALRPCADILIHTHTIAQGEGLKGGRSALGYLDPGGLFLHPLRWASRWKRGDLGGIHVAGSSSPWSASPWCPDRGCA